MEEAPVFSVDQDRVGSTSALIVLPYVRSCWEFGFIFFDRLEFSIHSYDPVRFILINHVRSAVMFKPKPILFIASVGQDMRSVVPEDWMERIQKIPVFI
jgi:hypothetical protein